MISIPPQRAICKVRIVELRTAKLHPLREGRRQSVEFSFGVLRNFVFCPHDAQIQPLLPARCVRVDACRVDVHLLPTLHEGFQ